MNSVPLADALPSWWDQIIQNHNDGKGSNFIPTILINDTIETDGRFLLYTLASQYLASTPSTPISKGTVPSEFKTDMNVGKPKSNSPSTCNGRKLFWIACGPATERQILTSLKKIGFDAIHFSTPQSLQSNSNSNTEVVKVVPIALELAQGILLESETEENTSSDNFEPHIDYSQQKLYLKKLYERFSLWIKREAKCSSANMSHQLDNVREGGALVIIDDLSALIHTFGFTLTMAFIQKIKHILSTVNGGLLGFRARIDLSTQNVQLLDFDTSHQLRKKDQSGNRIRSVAGNNQHHHHDFMSSSTWLGAGGGNNIAQEREYNSQFPHTRILDQSLLLEMAHGIIDVLPLSSGFAREVHGRLIFTERLCAESEWYKMKNGDHDGKGRIRFEQSEKNTRKLGFVRSGSKIQSSTKKTEATIVNYFCGDQGVKAIRLRS